MPGYKARDKKRQQRRHDQNVHAKAGNSSQSSQEARNTATAKQDSKHGQQAKNSPPARSAAVESAPSSSGSGGELLPVFESDGIRDVRLRERAIRKGWIKPGPNGEWPLDWTAEDFAKANEARGGKFTIAEQAAFAVLRDLNSDKASVRQTTVKAALAMKAQNLASRHHEERMDFHERSLEARVGNVLAGAGDIASGDVGVIIVIPHNNRDAPPPGAVIEGSVLSMIDDEPIEGSIDE